MEEIINKKHSRKKTFMVKKKVLARINDDYQW